MSIDSNIITCHRCEHMARDAQGEVPCRLTGIDIVQHAAHAWCPVARFGSTVQPAGVTFLPAKPMPITPTVRGRKLESDWDRLYQVVETSKDILAGIAEWRSYLTPARQQQWDELVGEFGEPMEAEGVRRLHNVIRGRLSLQPILPA